MTKGLINVYENLFYGIKILIYLCAACMLARMKAGGRSVLGAWSPERKAPPISAPETRNFATLFDSEGSGSFPLYKANKLTFCIRYIRDNTTNF